MTAAPRTSCPFGRATGPPPWPLAEQGEADVAALLEDHLDRHPDGDVVGLGPTRLVVSRTSGCSAMVTQATM